MAEAAAPPCRVLVLFFFSRFRAADFSTLSRRSFVDFFAAARAAFLSAFIHFVDGGPRAAFRFIFVYPAFFVTFLNVLGFAFLFAGVTGFASSWHKFPFAGN